MSKGKRNYLLEYKRFHSRPEQIKRRAARNKARQRLMKKGKVRKGDGKDVHHVQGIHGPVRAIARSKNRAFKRSSTGKNLGLR